MNAMLAPSPGPAWPQARFRCLVRPGFRSLEKPHIPWRPCGGSARMFHWNKGIRCRYESVEFALENLVKVTNVRLRHESKMRPSMRVPMPCSHVHKNPLTWTYSFHLTRYPGLIEQLKLLAGTVPEVSSHNWKDASLHVRSGSTEAHHPYGGWWEQTRICRFLTVVVLWIDWSSASECGISTSSSLISTEMSTAQCALKYEYPLILYYNCKLNPYVFNIITCNSIW